MGKLEQLNSQIIKINNSLPEDSDGYSEAIKSTLMSLLEIQNIDDKVINELLEGLTQLKNISKNEDKLYKAIELLNKLEQYKKERQEVQSQANQATTELIKEVDSDGYLESANAIIQELEDLSNINEKAKQKIENIKTKILAIQDKVSKAGEILSLAIEAKNIYDEYVSGEESGEDKKGNKKREKEEGNSEIVEKEKKYSKIFGESWGEVKKIWNINNIKDYNYLDKIADISKELLWTIGSTSVNLLKDGMIIVGKFSLKGLWESFKFIIKTEFNIITFTKDNWILLSLLIITHVRFGVDGYRHIRDWLISNKGSDWKDLSNNDKKVKKIKNSDGTSSTETIQIKKWRKKLADKYYINASEGDISILNLENADEKQNEYGKRRRTIEIYKSYYYDNPDILNELERIESRYLQSKSKTFWRRLFFVKRGLVRRGITSMYKIYKFEKENRVILLRNNFLQEYKKAISLLYETNITDNTNLKISIDKEYKTGFLEGLEGFINNNSNLTKKEKTKLRERLNNFLNEFTGNRIIDKTRLLEELYRIKEGLATKSEMLDKISEELKKGEELEIFEKIKKGTKNTFFRRKTKLKKFRKIIARGNWNGTWEEFIEKLEEVKKSKVYIKIKKRKINFGDQDEFIKEMETTHIDIEKKLKLYDLKDIKNLRNYIRYILPSLEEERIKNILDEFEKIKTPYEKLNFYRELNRIKEGFLPSNKVLEKLLDIKYDVLKDIKRDKRKEKETLVKKSIKHIKNLNIKLENNYEWKHLVDDNMKKEIRKSIGDLNALLNILLKDMSDINSIGKKDLFLRIKEELEIIEESLKKISNRLYNNFKNLFTDIKISFKNNNEKTIKDERIKVLDKIIKLAREGNLDLTAEDIEKLKNDPKNFYENIDSYISEDFNEAKKEALIKDLKQYEGLDDFDYKEFLDNPENLDKLEKALKEKYKKELSYIKVLEEITGEKRYVEEKLLQFAESLNKNDYTKGQAKKILEIIFSSQRNLDLEEVIRKTKNHKSSFDIQKSLTDEVVKEYNKLDEQRKKEILKFIKNDSLFEYELPDEIKKDLELYEEEERNIRRYPTITAELSRMMIEINNMTTQEELEELKKEFNKYIIKERIDRSKEEFKGLIQQFSEKYDKKKEGIRKDKEEKKEAEAREKQQEKLDKQISFLENYDDIPRSKKEYNKVRTNLKSKIGYGILPVYNSIIFKGAEGKIVALNRVINTAIQEKLIELYEERYAGVENIPEEIQEKLKRFYTHTYGAYRIPKEVLERFDFLQDYVLEAIIDTQLLQDINEELKIEIRQLESKQKMEIIDIYKDAKIAEEDKKSEIERKAREFKKAK